MPDSEQPTEQITLVVDETVALSRLDSFLASNFSNFSRAKLQRAIAKGKVTVDGKVAKASLKLKTGQSVSLTLPEQVSEAPIPEDIPLDIVFEDEHMAAVNKPPAMVVHPAKGHWSGTLTAALAFHFQNLSTVGGEGRPGIVHRLDRDTSGIILIAKTDEAHSKLAKQFELRTVKKTYWAIVSPAPDHDRGVIDKPIGTHPYQREKMAIRENHKSSRTASSFFEIMERFGENTKGEKNSDTNKNTKAALVLVQPKTGRTHQIRVHLAHLGSPVLCDRLYGGRAQIRVNEIDRRSKDDTVLLARQALHAKSIEFDHPETGERMKLEAKVPTDIEKTLDFLR